MTDRWSSRSRAAGVISRARSTLVNAPTDAAMPADVRTIDLAGLRLPARASVALTATTLLILIDFARVLLPTDVQALGRTSAGLLAIALERLVIFFVVPLGIIVVAFRDEPRRYGLTLGDAPVGAVLAVVGAGVMTPVVLWCATLPDVRAYYAVSAAPAPEVVAINAVDLVAAEFLYRGFLMFTLVRAVGPIGVLIAVMPFAFSHLGKPVLELLSTLVGGLAYGWLAWRTRSIVWGSIAHVYILSLVTVAAAAGATAAATGVALTP
jgi:membrane protease YdiL (CAAX protease family)